MSVLALIVALLCAAPTPDSSPALPDASAVWTQAQALERAGDYDGAQRVFAPLAEAHPQDYTIQLQAAWLAFLAEDYASAELRYARAVELSRGAPLARAGLAWTHLRQGRSRQARREFEALAADDPELEQAQAGLDALRRRRFAITPNAFAIGHVYGGHPSLVWAAGLSAAAPMVVAEHLLIRPGYRFAHFTTTDSPAGAGMMAGPGGSSESGSFVQHEAHLGLGGTWTRAGFLAHYAYLHDGSVAGNSAQIMGLSLRASPWGDALLDGSAAAFRESGWVGRVAPSWRMPATSWLAFRPGFALQFIAREVIGSGFASVIVHGRPGALVLGAKGGLEERPVYLETPAIFSFDGRILWGAWLAGDLRLPRGLRLHASYETHHLRAPIEGGTSPSQIHYIALGLSWSSAARDPS